MQITTREAVEISLNCMSDAAREVFNNDRDELGCRQLIQSMKLMCDHYGFKLSQFFDVEEA